MGGQSVFADAADAVRSVDLAYHALINEVDAGKMRMFLSDIMFDQEKTPDGKRVPIPFRKGDCTVFRKVMSTEDTITEFAPALRTEAQGNAFRLALQVLGDLVGLGVNYFDTDNMGYVKTATEASSDNSALMRNIRKNENALQGALMDVLRAVMTCGRFMGVGLPEKGDVGVICDDSFIQGTTSEKQQGMAEVAAELATREEYRSRWYGESSAAATAGPHAKPRTRRSLRPPRSTRRARRPVARTARRRSRKKSFSPYSEPLSSAAEPSSFTSSSFSRVDMALICPSPMSRASASLKAKSRSSSCPA